MHANKLLIRCSQQTTTSSILWIVYHIHSVSYTHLDVYKRQAHARVETERKSYLERSRRSVSYTHLDVYKRQALGATAPPRTGEKILIKYQKIIVCAV